MRFLLVAFAVLLPVVGQARPFDPFAFFAGKLKGNGRLKVAMRHAHAVRVQSKGRIANGVLFVDQRIEEAGEAPTVRQWQIHAVGPGRYAGTLSDAAGPIEGRMVGEQLVLRFRMKHGLRATQWLTLAADGQSAHNVMRIRRIGIVVATLDETIVRVR